MKKLRVGLMLALLFLTANILSQEWTMLNPIRDGDLLGSAFVIENTNTAYAGTLSGRLFKTENAGADWFEASHQLGYQISGTIWGIWFTDLNNGYIPTGTGHIYKTSDAGDSWVGAYLNTSKTLYGVHFPTPDTGYVCGGFGTVLRTIDAGLNWTELNTGVSTTHKSVWFTSPSVGYVTGYDGLIYKTIDAGSSWTALTTNYTGEIEDIQFFDANNGIAVGEPTVILKTSDGGLTWTTISSPLQEGLKEVNLVNSNRVFITGRDGTILLSTNGGNVFNSVGLSNNVDIYGFIPFSSTLCSAVGDGRIYHSFDGGNSWEARYKETPYANLSRIKFTSVDTGYAVGHSAPYYGSAGGILRTTDGGKIWERTFNSNLYDISFLSVDTGYVSGFNAVMKTNDAGDNWSNSSGAVSGANTAIYFIDENNGVLSGSNGLYKTSNGGSSWSLTQASSGFGQFQYSFFFVDENTGYVVGDDVLKTTDGGDSWTYLSYPGYNSQFGAVYFPNDSVGYIVGDNGGLKTTDAGATWSLWRSGNYRDLYFPDSTNADFGYTLDYYGNLKRTYDGGLTWQTIVNQPFDREFNSFSFVGDTIYASGSWGYIHKTTIPQPPSVDFTASQTTIMIGSTIDFSDLTSNAPSTWEWTFQGAMQSTSTLQNPTNISYNNLGCYDVTLKASNLNGADSIVKTCYIHVIPMNTSTYCIPNPTEGTIDGDFIDGVSLESINNMNTGSSTGANYHNFDSLITDLEQGRNFALDITGGNYSTDTYAAWIDYNKNDIFEANEKLGEFTTSATFETQTINFLVPLNTNIVDSTRMRIRCVRGQTGVDPCTDYVRGETEDYLINITQSTINVSEFKKEEGVSVYPNPFNSIINIEGIENGTEYSILHIDGRVAKSGTVQNEEINDLDLLPKGSYLLRLESAKGNVVKKIFK